MVPASNDQGLNKEEELDTQRHREVYQVKARTEIGLMWPQANKCQEPPSLEETKMNLHLELLEKREHGPLTPYYWTFGHQNCEKLNSYYFKPRDLWDFITTALGN